MCGIMGKVGAQLPAALPLEKLRHRGPDAQGWWSNGKTCILGHTRLAIIDLDSRANQPMTDPTGRYTIVFNGEIYNYQELARAHLADVTFVSSSDTEVLLRLWIRNGIKCLQLLRGMFAFAIWDELEQSLWLARDRIGKKPVVYSQDHTGLAFASEIGGLLPLLSAPPKLSLTGMDLFLGYQFIPAPYSIYENVLKLPAAHYGVWHNGHWRLERYWQLSFEPVECLEEKEALEQLETKIREATRLRLRADVPVGVLLSGGVDSSLVTAIAAQEYGQEIKTFSVGFEEQDFNELPYAEKVALQYRTEHHPICLRERVDEQFANMVERYGEPFGDKSALPSLFVCREAAKHVKVVLNGDGGDELLAGYAKYQFPSLKQKLARWTKDGYPLAVWLDEFARRFSDESLASALIQKGRYWVYPLCQVLLFDSFVRRSQQEKLYHPDVFKAVKTARQEYELALLGELALPPNLLGQMLNVDYRHYLFNDLLVKMDIASMTSSLETRSPLLDHELLEFAARLEASLKIRGSTGKYLLKKLAERYVPREIIDRPKHGFSIPVSLWVRTRFAGRLKDMVSTADHPLWEYCRPETASQWIRQHLKEEQDHGHRLWVLLVLGTWLQQNQPTRAGA